MPCRATRLTTLPVPRPATRAVTLFLALAGAVAGALPAARAEDAPPPPVPEAGARGAPPPAADNGDNLQGQQPRMEFTRLRHAFGALNRGEKVSHRFEFTNGGKGVLQVRSIHASCGCVNVKLEPKDTFAPGESGRVVFEFDSSLFVGDIVRTITVDTNAQNPSTQTLTFEAHVEPEILVRPNVITLGEIPKEFQGTFTVEAELAARGDGETGPHVLAAVNRSALSEGEKRDVLASDGPLRIIKAQTSTPALVATVSQEPGAKRAKISVKVNSALPIGPFRERLTLWNNSRHMKELVVALTGEVVGHVKPSAKYLEFGVVTAPQPVRRSLKLDSDTPDFKVNAVEVDLRRSEALKALRAADLVSVTTDRTKEGVVVHFDMRVPPLGKEASRNVNASGTFVVRTTDPDYKEIRVPFFGVLRREK